MGSTPAPGTVFRRPRGNRRARHERKEEQYNKTQHIQKPRPRTRLRGPRFRHCGGSSSSHCPNRRDFRHHLQTHSHGHAGRVRRSDRRGRGCSKAGFCTRVVEQTVGFRTAPPTLNPSDRVLTFAEGDQLTVSFHGTGTPDQTNPAFVKLSGTGTITGGTGCFQNATGELRAPGVAHVDTAPGVFPAEGHGTFALEGLVRLKAL